ncbi:hypothetical protein D9758_016836 [Tetrapyrgos nigripes]|uniref:Uncharacterized protein n=1 Tax=Tetrapyrgos nigripes TaxID=182062 RepID=A0A8H5CBA4_9AGAR|nr:hypothetical protein D9758_016836 [Tetrapyrgos nigripes]
MTSTPELPPLSVGRQYGPLLIGAKLDAILLGVLIVQSPHRDSRWVRCMVVFLLAAEIINTGLDIGIVWEPLITNFGAYDLNGEESTRLILSHTSTGHRTSRRSPTLLAAGGLIIQIPSCTIPLIHSAY